MFIGGILQNFGAEDYVLEEPEDPTGLFKLTFIAQTIPDYVTVRVSYTVFETNGGERSYTLSTIPVYRPPFFLKAGVDNFGLRGDRTADFTPGQIFRLGADCFYVRKVEYFPPRETPLLYMTYR